MGDKSPISASVEQRMALSALAGSRDSGEAERAVSDALAANKTAIEQWAQAGGTGTRAFSFSAGRVIGQGVVRSTGQLSDMTNMVVVLRKIVSGSKPYFVLTAYPKP